jgi:8-oxo-dGTP pyrophosphatase MutT (NUDIX family)
LRNRSTAQGSTTDAFGQAGPRDTERRAFERKIRAILANRSRRTLSDPSLTCAAVLIPLLLRDGEWCVLLTQRTQHVEHHKGQISFPGGACDPEDASLEVTALREVHEEIGIPPEAVQVLGAVDDLQTVTDFAVTPFVGIIPHPFSYRLNPAEVEAVIEVPLAFLRDSDNLRIGSAEYKGERHDVLCWDYGPHVIWGATARILKGFIDLLP